MQENRITRLFKEKQRQILSIYFTAGFPTLNSTLEIVEHIEKGGADLIEIGIPFSDPVADGPTIQASNQKALENGMTLALLFDQLKGLRDKVSIPVVLMGYVNPILQFGVEQFCKQCMACGVDGVILPDLPIEVYIEEYKSIFEKYGIKNMLLITPQTSEERIRLIDENTDGFIYMVSSASTTGAKNSFGPEQSAYFNRINNMHLKAPTLVGFGISNHQTFMQASEYGSGAIIGSAFIHAIANSTNLEADIKNFIHKVKNA